MTEPLPLIIESSLQIAWDFLERSGGIEDPERTAEILLASIKTQILKGENRTLMLSNRAIAAVERRKAA
ncbi:hypothetical protein JQ554_27225 [Bradyrhizobium diazoefficiens]|jgi:hypothetical protein|nr:hypothetical protein [Bradyrhizobium diazoefficiens]MBR0967933.1 hypothetical protein [Bradyrhizobium diazoefficiens]MBR0981330.1 hypothetical protein [Bradyrhizobium diazoefficiens]MBR1010784.1 hypothetical protein [Bradyrhizobium diazoefficiens]MBR1017295.1 hypothetical protein [Bradyrhizobium diazoefficiens]MBR1054543.1 hypothetical protein [Bradyrhizobium diazoefficiens]